jgi:hypothetical protein
VRHKAKEVAIATTAAKQIPCAGVLAASQRGEMTNLIQQLVEKRGL